MNSVERIHRMPFGSELRDDGVLFQLWAPAAHRVDLHFATGATNGHGRSRPMTRDDDGWYRVTVPEAAPGTEYYFLIDGELRAADPASRHQPRGVNGPSEVIDPCVKRWRDGNWRGRAWEDAIIYELHVGAFSPAGNFAGVRNKLGYLGELGVNAILLMPVAEFPGARNWGYDGVLPFAPSHQYGRPEHFKALVEAAHQQGLMVLLDVVYSHFGPRGNFLSRYAPAFFDPGRATPWGDAIHFDGEQSHWVRQFFLHNALYWLEEFHLDGLRFDAVHTMRDESEPDFLTELAQTVRDNFTRPIHLLLENAANEVRYLERDEHQRPRLYTAQFNDDIHHAMHVLLTGESTGYYQDYADDPLEHLARCLASGFSYQGEASAYRHGQLRGSASGHLPPTALIAYLQNHDQVGNRAFGERLVWLGKAEAMRAATALLLMAPSPPLLFMGQEWGCDQPFLYFCDYDGDLARAIAEGRRREFARFPAFNNAVAREHIPDPLSEQTFLRSRLNWTLAQHLNHQRWRDLHRQLLALRREFVAPRLTGISGNQAPARVLGEQALAMTWQLGDGSRLQLLANLHDAKIRLNPEDFVPPTGELLYATHADTLTEEPPFALPPWSVFWHLAEPGFTNR